MEDIQNEQKQKLTQSEKRLIGAEKRLSTKNYQMKISEGAVLVASDISEIPRDKVKDIVSFIEPMTTSDLMGNCIERTSEAVFSGYASYAYDHEFDPSGKAVMIENRYHRISGDRLDDGYIAFDPTARTLILETEGKKPLAQTIIFYSKNENELKDMISQFYGASFSKVEVEDNPYERAIAKRN